ncbi:hypothetical protein P3X46_029715 [Hevea brasiliensis]|uniref:Glycosyltransferase n=3 Tax=Hevea brasiliensis TaxID=3981 RepID=A0A6A6MKS8_HEVBR|nr:hypothetical protein GH714_012213 [Hevea brasiliensis]KAJ9147569.1 hypothetical protein P3X46_029715 [Hevea brasiliensis]
MLPSHTPSPHIALIPSAGMGHLTPFLRLASLLLSRNCNVTLVTAKSTVSNAESDHISFFLTTHPRVKHLEFDVIPLHSSNPSAQDPFLIQYNAISRSAHLLHPLLSSSSPPLSAIFCDLLVAKSVARISADLRIPYYLVITTSARFLSFMLHLPVLVSNPDKFNSSIVQVEIPGLTPFSIASIPLPFLNPNHLLAASIIANVGVVPEAKGIMVNTFDWFEAETIAALNNGKVLSNLPPVIPIGPVQAYELQKDQSPYLLWLDDQPEKSVVYVSFGSRTAMSNDQIRELGYGLDKSGCRFLWVVKTTKVDKEDKAGLEELLGESFLERIENRGMVVKGWVNQDKILAHPATGGFISHCGWNSVTESAERGVPVLAWPLHGDQRVNAEVLQKAGLGIMEKTWGMGTERLVKHEEIGKKIVELMDDAELRNRAKKVGEEARKSTELGGSSDEAIMEIIEKLT